MTPAEFRKRFPILSHRVYVNSCSQGALSVDVEESIAAYLESWHREGSPWELWVAQVNRLRERFATSIGAHADEIAVVPSASAGINAIASALDFTRERSHVAMGPFEFPTMAQIWLAQRPRGATIRWADAEGDLLPVDAYGRVIDERTLIVPTTHVCFRNGHRTEIAGVVRLAHDRGAYVFLDDYQRTGSGPIDVHALGVDFMVTGCLKYLLAEAGIGFLYVRRDLVDRLEPAMTGWFGRVNPFDFRIDRIDWPPSATRFETGTPPVPNAYASLAALDLLNRMGYDAIGAQVDRLVAKYHAAASDRGFVVKTPDDPARRGPLVVLECVDAPRLVSRLAGRGIVASCRGNGLRVSFHAYNDEADVDAVVRALDAESMLLVRREARPAAASS
jgi:selenocysteine lyase/cysteine desulfurase